MLKKLRVRKSLIVVGILVGCLSLVNLSVVACQTKEGYTGQSWASQADRPLGAWMLGCKYLVNGTCQCPETKAAQGASTRTPHQSGSSLTMEQIKARIAQARAELDALTGEIDELSAK